MEIRGHIVQILPLQSGVSQASGREWKKQEYILETGDQYPRKVCFQLFGDRVDQFPMAVGEEVVVSCDIESREYNGRWTQMSVLGKSIKLPYPHRWKVRFLLLRLSQNRQKMIYRFKRRCFYSKKSFCI